MSETKNQVEATEVKKSPPWFPFRLVMPTGIYAYDSPDAQRMFARSLIRLSEKCLWAAIFLLPAMLVARPNDEFKVGLWVAGSLAVLGVTFQRAGLSAIDKLPVKKAASKKRSKAPDTTAITTASLRGAEKSQKDRVAISNDA